MPQLCSSSLLNYRSPATMICQDHFFIGFFDSGTRGPMFCASCGAPDQKPNAYCRQCGQWLVDVKSAGSHGAKSPEQRLNVMIAFNLTSSLMALISAVALYATYLGRPDALWSIYVAGAFLTVITVHQAVSFFFALGLKKTFKRRRDERTQELNSNLTNGELTPGSSDTQRLISVPSVVEDTTQLLEASGRQDAHRLSERN